MTPLNQKPKFTSLFNSLQKSTFPLPLLTNHPYFQFRLNFLWSTLGLPLLSHLNDHQ